MAAKKLKIKCSVPVKNKFVCEIPAGYDRVGFRPVGVNKIYAIATGPDKHPIQKKISPKVSNRWRKICPKN